MASPSCSRKPSSSSSFNSKWRYDVFLSFRGEDTRNSFTDHLYRALDRANIKTFRDDEELPRGEEISPQLLKSIEGSRIAIIVFSKTYAHSKWCLDELVKIMECEEQKGQKVFPIFYHVEPSEVRNQTGIYREAFKKHERNADEEKKKKKIDEWKAALRKGGNLSGFPLQDGYESKFIDEIVGEIRRLIPKLVHVGENIVGMDENLKRVKLLMDAKSNEVSMVGIYGIGGIGKTTIAKVIYNDMLDQFKHHSFLENVRERSKDDHGLLQLQEKLLCDILMEKNLTIHNVDEGIKMIKRKCYLEKVLIVLDDVDCPRQLKFLASSSEWFGRGSIIIVTTRNKRCLDVHTTYSSYEAKELADDKALELFCWSAFQQHHPRDNYVDLCTRVLHYAKGLPLAVVVLGCFLFQRDEEEWESTLCKLKIFPHENIQKVLQISYDGLDDRCKKLFLDVACFFKDCRAKIVTRILEGCKFHPKIELKVLDERCLISISGGFIRMHDLLQEMGWAVVREKYPENPGKWSRLWEYEDIKSVLTKNLGTKNIEGMFLNKTTAEPIELHAQAFKKMKRLRLLKVGFNMVQLSQDFEWPCRELTYLDWSGYSLESMPSNFHADNLVELHLQFSHIRHLCRGNMHAGMLKILDLSYSEQLVDISSLSNAPNLEFLILQGCRRLKSLPTKLHKFKRLQTLSCADCSEIKSFPEIEENMGRLRELDFSRTGIIEVPSSIRHLQGLEFLDLSYCENLLSLPDSFCSLSSLKTLRVENCPIKSFPEIGENMVRLRELDFRRTGIIEVPSSIRHLHGLVYLDLSHCQNLFSLPDSIFSLSSLKTLGLKHCPILEATLNVKLEVRLSSLQRLNLTCHIVKGVVIWENKCFSSLKTLSPRCDQREEDILNHTYPLSSMVQLCITNSSSKGIQNDSFHHPSSLQISCLSNFHEMEGRIPCDIFHQSSLENLSLHNFNFKEVGIPLDNWHLPLLHNLSLGYCNLMEGEVLNHVCHLSSLRELDLQGSHFSSIPVGISRLPNLRVLDLSHCNHFSCIPADISRLSNLISLNLSHCKNLQQIPELPSSLRLLDAHGSDRISSSSLFLQFRSLNNWFKSELLNQDSWISNGDSNSRKSPGISIVFPKSIGILEGISYQSIGSDEVTIELPPNWYENNDLLGFALYFVCVGIEFGCRWRFRCPLLIQGNYEKKFLGYFSFGCCLNDCDKSDIAWIMCYPKVAIKECYRSNQWTHFMASCRGTIVERCSIHLIYAKAKDYEQMHHPSMIPGSSSHGNFGDDGSPTQEDDYTKALHKRSSSAQCPVEESHHKRFRGTPETDDLKF